MSYCTLKCFQLFLGNLIHLYIFSHYLNADDFQIHILGPILSFKIQNHGFSAFFRHFIRIFQKRSQIYIFKNWPSNCPLLPQFLLSLISLLVKDTSTYHQVPSSEPYCSNQTSVSQLLPLFYHPDQSSIPSNIYPVDLLLSISASWGITYIYCLE